MKIRSTSVRLKGTVERRHEAEDLLVEAGDAVLVYRGVARSLAMACPDGCGDKLTINLDSRAGPAWRYFDKEGISLYPSVWRDTGCQSHFILWRSRIYWCDSYEAFETVSQELDRVVLDQLSDSFQEYTSIALALGEIPWAVLSACNSLVAGGYAQRGAGRQRNSYRRVAQAR
jgi:hypothetical protein